MRDIKFRAWDKVDGMKHFNFSDLAGRYVTIDHGVYYVPVMQYAEVKDEDEKAVYEHDIVQFAIFDYNGADTQYTGVVKFSDGQWQLWKSADEPYYGSDGPFNMHMVWYNDDGFKVIGNIYEHPHLLSNESS